MHKVIDIQSKAVLMLMSLCLKAMYIVYVVHLSFSTGSDVIPPSGSPGCTLLFSSHDPYRTASTCPMEFKLPTKHFAHFKAACCMAFSAHGGFGLGWLASFMHCLLNILVTMYTQLVFIHHDFDFSV